MAEVSKEHKLKLANSRKRFKELQEQKRKKDAAAQKTDNSTEYDDSTRQPPADSLTCSTHSSVNNDPPLENISDNSRNSAPLPNYFADTNYGDNSMFFDSISKPEEKVVDEYISNRDSKSYKTNQDLAALENKVSSVVDNSKPVDNQVVQYSTNYSLFPEESPHNYVCVTQHILHPNQEVPDNYDTYLGHTLNTIQDDSYHYSSSHDVSSVDYPEIKQNEIYEIHNNVQNQNMFISECGQIDGFQSNKESLNEVNNSTIKNEIVDNSNNAQEEIRHSSIESLKQLSNHMAEMVEPEYVVSSSITDLEKRNLELAALLEQRNLEYEQQQVQIEELQYKIKALETDGKRKEDSLKLQSTSEISRLREELQCHIQTVGLLVAEKTELSASLSQLELTAKQKVSECEELQARLKASRSRAFELEQDLNIFKNDRNKKENMGIEQDSMIEKLKQEVAKLQEQKEELFQDLLEAREKLKNSSVDKLNLQKQFQEISSKLSLAEIRIQQISNSEQQQFDSQIEKLSQEKFESENQVSSLELMLKTMTKERDESTSHYQQYTQDLNAQMTNLTNQIQRLQQENEKFSMQEQSRIKHIGELERQLQNLQNEQVAFATNRTSEDHNLKNEIGSVKELCVQLQVSVFSQLGFQYLISDFLPP